MVRSGQSERTRARVLVVEDAPLNRLLVRKLLEAEGLAVDVAEGGEEAVGAVAGADYAAIFMDCQMPGLDGYGATGAIRAAEAGRRVPIVALTGHAGDGERERCLAAGMDDYLTKPIGAGELRRVLDRWVGGLDEPVLELLRGEFDARLRERLLGLFLAQAPAAIETMCDAARAGDAEHLRTEAHRLKGSCLNLGAERMRSLCQALERLGEGGAMDGADGLLDDLAAAFELTRERLPGALVAR